MTFAACEWLADHGFGPCSFLSCSAGVHKDPAGGFVALRPWLAVDPSRNPLHLVRASALLLHVTVPFLLFLSFLLSLYFSFLQTLSSLLSSDLVFRLACIITSLLVSRSLLLGSFQSFQRRPPDLLLRRPESCCLIVLQSIRLRCLPHPASSS